MLQVILYLLSLLILGFLW